MTKRLLAVLLALSLLLGILPMGAGAQATQSQLLGEEDYAEAITPKTNNKLAGV